MNSSDNADLESAGSTKKNAAQSAALSIGSALLDQVKPEYRAASQHFALTDNTTVADVMESIGLSSQLSLLIVLNDSLVTRPNVSSQRVSNGDNLSLMPPIHAG